MAARTRLKILTTSSTTSAPNILKTGELAYSYEAVSAGQGQAGERLYIGTGAEDGNGVASSVQTIGVVRPVRPSVPENAASVAGFWTSV